MPVTPPSGSLKAATIWMPVCGCGDDRAIAPAASTLTTPMATVRVSSTAGSASPRSSTPWLTETVAVNARGSRGRGRPWCGAGRSARRGQTKWRPVGPRSRSAYPRRRRPSPRPARRCPGWTACSRPPRASSSRCRRPADGSSPAPGRFRQARQAALPQTRIRQAPGTDRWRVRRNVRGSVAESTGRTGAGLLSAPAIGVRTLNGQGTGSRRTGRSGQAVVRIGQRRPRAQGAVMRSDAGTLKYTMTLHHRASSSIEPPEDSAIRNRIAASPRTRDLHRRIGRSSQAPQPHLPNRRAAGQFRQPAAPGRTRENLILQP